MMILSLQAMTTCSQSPSDYLKGSFKDAEKFIQGGNGPAYSDAGIILVQFLVHSDTKYKPIESPVSHICRI